MNGQLERLEGEGISVEIIPLHQNINSSDTIVDYLEITNGYLPTDPVYAFYRRDLRTSFTGGNFLTLKYSKISHRNLNNSFLIEYETFYHNNIFIESNDTYYLESPNYPESYAANKECLWNIQAPDNHGVSIKFYDFELKESKDCVDDFLEIRHGNLPNDHHTEIYSAITASPV
ncbi:Similar to tld: Dorsal-ventral patterning protein tolloid (Drosophila melanogaster) [Cotesia congregata]|uniref:Similar to tld: Dorsal-ventral patterning protein tolloid (Drosophila melanogaster) n=1 Tax=Cotesia congregata TaxID=51543 RepID=A0A8J2H9E4_COTCN|nr:Similar to tld: Dorsal-ventral patterning protein tolloid (Drosophila melanogaster) [Cotesia congregata]